MLVAVDTGGTKTLVTGFLEDGKAGAMIKFPTPPREEDYVTLLRNTIIEQFYGKPVEAIVIAMPGIVKDGVAIWCNNLHWKNFNVGKALKGILGKDVPVFIENDANLAGLAEARALAPMPESVLYVTVSTGIGTGIITDGHIDPGLRYSEGGRTLVEYKGEIREWETFASGKAIRRTYGKYASEIKNKRTWDSVADRLSRGFLATIPILQPDAIVIGGSIGTYYDNYATRLQDILEEHLPAHIPLPRFYKAKHPEEAVIYGCYYYALDQLTRR